MAGPWCQQAQWVLSQLEFLHNEKGFQWRFRAAGPGPGSEACSGKIVFFPTCQVRVVRFYVSCLVLLVLLLLLLLLLPLLVLLLLLLLVLLVLLLLHCDPCQCALPDLNHDHPRQCALPDLNHDHPRPVFPAGPQPRPSTPSVPCRTSTTTIPAQCSLPDLNHDHPRPVFPAGPQPRVSTPSVPCRTSCRKIWDKECAEES